MSASTFLDSNVLIYLFDRTDDRKRRRATDIASRGVTRQDTVISFQVVQETLRFITSKMILPLDEARRGRFLNGVLIPLWTVMPSAALYRRALELQDRYRYSFYDSLIIAAALEAGCSRILSEDLHDGQEIEGLRIENPFAP